MSSVFLRPLAAAVIRRCRRVVEAGVPPASEGGIMPPGATHRVFHVLAELLMSLPERALVPPGGTPRLTGRQDACRYGEIAGWKAPGFPVNSKSVTRRSGIDEAL